MPARPRHACIIVIVVALCVALCVGTRCSSGPTAPMASEPWTAQSHMEVQFVKVHLASCSHWCHPAAVMRHWCHPAAVMRHP